MLLSAKEQSYLRRHDSSLAEALIARSKSNAIIGHGVITEPVIRPRSVTWTLPDRLEIEDFLLQLGFAVAA